MASSRRRQTGQIGAARVSLAGVLVQIYEEPTASTAPARISTTPGTLALPAVVRGRQFVAAAKITR
jgi:hypothetical protein